MSSSTSYSSPGADGPWCECGLKARIRTSKTEHNPGGRFYSCRGWKRTGGGCEFFEWIDTDGGTPAPTIPPISLAPISPDPLVPEPTSPTAATQIVSTNTADAILEANHTPAVMVEANPTPNLNKSRCDLVYELAIAERNAEMMKFALIASWVLLFAALVIKFG